jgi:hypothetical protein
MFEGDLPEYRGGDRRQSAEGRAQPGTPEKAAPAPKACGKHPHPKPSVRLKTDGRHFFFAPGSWSL